MTFEEIAKSAMTITEKEADSVARQAIKDYGETLTRMNGELAKLYAVISDGIPPKEYFNYATKYNRLTNLIDTLTAQYNQLIKRVGGITEAGAIAAISNSYYRNMYVLNFDSVGFFQLLSPEVVNVSVYGTQKAWDEIRDTKTFGLSENYLPQSGTLLSELLIKRKPETLAEIERVIRAGLLSGDGYRKMVPALRKVMETDAEKALRIIRTETHRNMSAGQYAMQQAAKSKGIKAKRMIVSTLDMRTREQSGFVDGQKEDDNGYFHYPGGVLVAIPGNSGVAKWDINDRETTIMTTEGLPPETRRARSPVKDPVTKKYETDIISWKYFDDWMKENNLMYKKGAIVYK